MVKIMINCRKCGKEIRLELSDSRALCKKCRKTTIVLEKKMEILRPPLLGNRKF